MHHCQLYPVLRAAVYTVGHQLTYSHKCSGKPDKAAVRSLPLTPKKSIKQWRETLISPEKGRNTESNQWTGLLWRVLIFKFISSLVPKTISTEREDRSGKVIFLQQHSLHNRVSKRLIYCRHTDQTKSNKSSQRQAIKMKETKNKQMMHIHPLIKTKQARIRKVQSSPPLV